MLYTKQSYVPASMCDAATKLSDIAVFQVVEDAVTELMGDLHIDGITAMREYDAMWVFVKNCIRIFRRPRWREEYETRCFVSGVSAVKLLIDTELRTPDGEPLIHSRLELCALDLKKGRIRRTGTVGVSADMIGGEPLPELAFARFPKETPQIMETVTVRSTNLDYCSHTNNVEYVRFILNTYPAATFQRRELRLLEIHYGNQTHEGDELQIGKIPLAGADYFSVSAGGKTAAECMLRWEEA